MSKKPDRKAPNRSRPNKVAARSTTTSAGAKRKKSSVSPKRKSVEGATGKSRARATMISAADLDDLAVGGAILGTGGGGDPYIGKLMAQRAIREHGPVRMIDVDEVDDDALVVPCAMMGPPTVMVEKIPQGGEILVAFRKLERFLGKKIGAILCAEAGGLNSTIPFVIGAMTGIPVIDGAPDTHFPPFPNDKRQMIQCAAGFFARGGITGSRTGRIREVTKRISSASPNPLENDRHVILLLGEPWRWITAR